MSRSLEKERSSFLNGLQNSLSFEERVEFKKQITKKYIDYAFSKEFEKQWEEEHLRELHPALQDLRNQYLEMEKLLKKEKI